MATVRPFAAIRPKAEYAEQVVAPPYDVMSTEEAKQMTLNKPFSFLHVSRSEIDLPEIKDPHSEAVYLKARENLEFLLASKLLIREEKACYYIYQQGFLGRVQIGIVATFSVDEYVNNTIKKHELTLVEKEKDRTEHFNACSAHTEPVFLTYHHEDQIQEIIDSWAEKHNPLFDFSTDDQVTHRLWVIDKNSTIDKLERLFLKVPYLYIADGHHRSASAAKIGLERRETAGNYTGEEEFNFFMGVLFPHNQLKIYDYNRLVKDLNNLSKEEFLEKLTPHFTVSEIGLKARGPEKKHTFSMYLEGLWYSLELRNQDFTGENPVDSLDVSILQNLVLEPILGIKDPRTDNRINFSGGVRGLTELKKRVDGGMAAAFALYPPSMEDLLKIADMGLMMPPKSTWFEPKLASGLFIHEF